MKRTKKTRKSPTSTQRIIHRARYGGLARYPEALTAARLAKARCKEGYTALHYAARFGHLDQVHGGVTVAQLARVKSEIDWILHYNAATGKQHCQAFSGVTALSVAVTYGHLDQIKDAVTLSKLRSAKDADGRTTPTSDPAPIPAGISSDSWRTVPERPASQ